jgi:hypothetical protein
MRRVLVLILISAASLMAQIRWKCDPKDGKFAVTMCKGCKRFYCWDGEIFSEEEGYTPPPSYVLDYWEQVHRRSQQIREEIDRRGKELKQKVEQGKQETARLNQERAQAHKEFMDDLNRRVAAPRSTTTAPRPSAAIAQRATPRDVVVDAPAGSVPATAIPPASRARVSDVQPGMSRAAVESVLGKPHSAISIPDDEGLVETLTYSLDDRSTARVRIVQGKVVSVKTFD